MADRWMHDGRGSRRRRPSASRVTTVGALAVALATALALVGGCAGRADERSRPDPVTTAGEGPPPGGGAGAIPAEPTTPPIPTSTAPSPPTTPDPTGAPSTEPTAAPTLADDGRPATVVRVVDGDTIEVDGGERVRLIGIDTPETKDPRRPVGCFGAEASARTAALLAAGTPVRLVGDVEPTDRYGRTLAYVVRAEDDLFVNLALVAEGFALVATYPPNVAHVDELVAAQSRARGAGLGLWSACSDTNDADDADDASGTAGTTTTSAPIVPTPSAGSRDATCSPSYPTLCLPPAPDLDCGDLGDRRFPVLPPDPHRLDGNGDGVGCES